MDTDIFQMIMNLSHMKVFLSFVQKMSFYSQTYPKNLITLKKLIFTLMKLKKLEMKFHSILMEWW